MPVSVEPVETPSLGWSSADTPTTLVLVRHGVTVHTAGKLFSGGLGGANPGLTDEGRDQVVATAEWLVPIAHAVDAVIASPVLRTRESAAIVAEHLGHPVEIEDGIAEMDFGAWDGLSFAQVQERHPDDLRAWLGALDVAAGMTGESFETVRARVLAGRDRLLASYAGRTVVAVSHVTPIKVIVADALGAPLDALYRMELSPASVTVVSYYPESPRGRPALASLSLFNARPSDAPLTFA